jgi:FAD:protein FMN transferase
VSAPGPDPGPASGDGARLLRTRILPAAFLALLFGALWLRRPAEQPPSAPQAPPAPVLRLTGPSMGTTWHATVVGGEDPSRATAAIQGALDAVDVRMSTWKADSELSLLNQAAAGSYALSPELAAVMAISFEVNLLSGGAFDVTVAPIVDAWGFGPAQPQAAPSPAEIEALRDLVGPDKLTFSDDGAELVKAADGVRADLSAVAKGYGVDQAAEALQALGYQDLMVEVGGEVRAHGRNPDGQPWRIGVERPDGSAAVEQVVALDALAMATSGDYRNYRELDGQRVSHTVDARSGEPIRHGLASVSVLHPSCAWADAWATALNVLGPDDGPALAARLDLPALFIVRSPDGFRSLPSPAWPAPAPPETP